MQLEVEIARKAFTNAAGERQDVLVDFNFALGTGEIGVFVGPSGCGKSTMLKIIAGLDHDYQGRVVCPAGARIGIVFQEPRLLPWRSFDDNVRLAAPKAEDKKLSELFAVLELTAHRLAGRGGAAGAVAVDHVVGAAVGGPLHDLCSVAGRPAVDVRDQPAVMADDGVVPVAGGLQVPLLVGAAVAGPLL